MTLRWGTKSTVFAPKLITVVWDRQIKCVSPGSSIHCWYCALVKKNLHATPKKAGNVVNGSTEKESHTIKRISLEDSSLICQLRLLKPLIIFGFRVHFCTQQEFGLGYDCRFGAPSLTAKSCGSLCGHYGQDKWSMECECLQVLHISHFLLFFIINTLQLENCFWQANYDKFNQDRVAVFFIIDSSLHLIHHFSLHSVML